MAWGRNAAGWGKAESGMTTRRIAKMTRNPDTCPTRDDETCSSDKLATKSCATGPSWLIGNVDARRGATNRPGDGFGQCADLGLEFMSSRQLAFHNTNEHGQVIGTHRRSAFRVVMTGEPPQAYPGLARRRCKDDANGVGKRLRKIRPGCMIRFCDQLHRDDWHGA